MVDGYRKFMKWGRLVEAGPNKTKYKIIENMYEVKNEILAVAVENWRRYELLKAWESNWTRFSSFRERFDGDIKACEAERKDYEVVLPIDQVEPADEIRFIDACYNTKFVVKNFGFVAINGEKRKVFYVDPLHFGFVTDENEEGSVFHACEFAELCDRVGLDVQKVVSEAAASCLVM